MNTKKFEKLLMERRRTLVELEGDAEGSCLPVELDQTRVGRLSRMDALQGQAMAQEVARRRDNEIARIDSALKRIKEDEFGYCLACGELIAGERLLLDPTVAICISCASA